MDARFQPAVAAIQAGDLQALGAILATQPALATARSTCSHPTLLQCCALDAAELPNQVEMAALLVAAGAEVDAPLVAAACIDNVPMVAYLLDAGGALNGDGEWSPLEEALYWGHRASADLLLEHGATIHNLRIAAGTGRTPAIAQFFDAAGNLSAAAGKVAWPFRGSQRVWPSDPQSVIDNAFAYACINDRLEAVQLLLEKGAAIDAIAPGFDYSGTPLHQAAVQGHRRIIEYLLARGAPADRRDTKVGKTPADWAAYGGHADLAADLVRAAGGND
jgi:ankyrin repeat protein